MGSPGGAHARSREAPRQPAANPREVAAMPACKTPQSRGQEMREACGCKGLICSGRGPGEVETHRGGCAVMCEPHASSHASSSTTPVRHGVQPMGGAREGHTSGACVCVPSTCAGGESRGRRWRVLVTKMGAGWRVQSTQEVRVQPCEACAMVARAGLLASAVDGSGATRRLHCTRRSACGLNGRDLRRDDEILGAGARHPLFDVLGRRGVLAHVDSLKAGVAQHP